MRPLFHTPAIGERLFHVSKLGTLPCRVIEVSPAVCRVELLAGGVANALAGQVIKTHVALLRTN